MKSHVRTVAVAGFLLVAIGCIPSMDAGATGSSPSQLGPSDLDALAQMFANGSVGSRGLSGAVGSAAFGGAGDDLHLQTGGITSWSPQALGPTEACSGGGSVHSAVNCMLSTPSGCCGANPPCQQDSASVQIQGGTFYNGCVEGSVTMDGSLTLGATGQVIATCAGLVTGEFDVTLSGAPSIRVNGVEVCSGPVLASVHVQIGGAIVVTVSGSACGEHFSGQYSMGCAVDCGGKGCCPQGSTCSACSNSCVPVAYPVDCCDGYSCPAGTTCTANNRCSP